MFHGHQEYLELSEFRVFENVNTLWQKAINGPVEGQHEGCAWCALLRGFDFYRGKFKRRYAVCLNRKRVANDRVEQFVRRISEIHKDPFIAAFLNSASYNSINKFES